VHAAPVSHAVTEAPRVIDVVRSLRALVEPFRVVLLAGRGARTGATTPRLPNVDENGISGTALGFLTDQADAHHIPRPRRRTVGGGSATTGKASIAFLKDLDHVCRIRLVLATFRIIRIDRTSVFGCR
jgi:hypothetical protein